MIVHTFLFTGANAFARQLDIPDVSVQFFPMFVGSRNFPHLSFPELPLGRRYNRLTHFIGSAMFFLGQRAMYPRVRKAIPGAPARIAWPFKASGGRPATPLVLAYSPALIPPEPDWGAHVHRHPTFVTGVEALPAGHYLIWNGGGEVTTRCFWNLDEAFATPDAGLTADDYVDRDARDFAMAEWLDDKGVELVVCAGYMHLLQPVFLERFPRRVVNVHPAPLPDFPGAHPLEDVLASGAPAAAATVHFVDEGVDTGAVIASEAVPVRADDTVESPETGSRYEEDGDVASTPEDERLLLEEDDEV